METDTVKREDEADELSREQRLRQLNEQTNEDGTIDVTLTDWDEPESPDSPNAKATVYFTVAGHEYSIKVDYPQAGEKLQENEFNLLLHEAGLSMDMTDFEHASQVKARRADDGSWEFVLPSRTSESMTQKIHRVYHSFFTIDDKDPGYPTRFGPAIFFAVLFPIAVGLSIGSDDFDSQEWGVATMYMLGTMLWGGGVVFAALFFGLL